MGIVSIVYRLYEPEDLEQTVRLVNRIFQHTNPPLAPERWARLEAGDHVTVVAEKRGRIVGAIPFDLRDLRLRPGVTIRGAFAHCVGVDETLRGLGVGSRMMALARQELWRYCHGLFVYTGGEGCEPYTFYERNGFVDLHYTDNYTLVGADLTAPEEAIVAPLDAAAPPGAALEGPFQAAYGYHAGFPPREADYWRRALDSIIYAQMPPELYWARVEQGDELAGYVLWGERSEGDLQQGAVILELAARPGLTGVAEKLLRAVVAAARAHGLPTVSMRASFHHPALTDLLALGFRPAGREHAHILAGQVIDLGAVWQRLAGAEAPALRVWTPGRQVELPGYRPAVRLEMKEATLQRLFLCRLGLDAALESDAVTAPLRPLPLPALHAILRPAVWLHHEIDWI